MLSSKVKSSFNVSLQRYPHTKKRTFYVKTFNSYNIEDRQIHRHTRPYVYYHSTLTGGNYIATVSVKRFPV